MPKLILKDLKEGYLEVCNINYVHPLLLLAGIINIIVN